MAERPTRPPLIVADRFEVIGRLASGAFGVVYRAKDLETGARVAFKTLTARAAELDEQHQRLVREAEIASQLTHPNAVAMLGRGSFTPEDGARPRPWIAFELVRGLPLDDVIRARGTLRLAEAVHVTLQILAVLEEVHELGIIHRDLKPANVLIEAPQRTWRAEGSDDTLPGRLGVPALDHEIWQDLTQRSVKLVDFGLGKLLDVGGRKHTRLTDTGMAAGTVYYMAPEQVRGRKTVDYRADLYGAAMLMYRMLTGKPPYDEGNLVEIAMAHVNKPPPELPPELQAHPFAGVFRKAAAKAPSDRQQSAAELAWELRAALDPDVANQPRPDFSRPPELTQPGLLARLLGIG